MKYLVGVLLGILIAGVFLARRQGIYLRSPIEDLALPDIPKFLRQRSYSLLN